MCVCVQRSVGCRRISCRSRGGEGHLSLSLKVLYDNLVTN